MSRWGGLTRLDNKQQGQSLILGQSGFLTTRFQVKKKAPERDLSKFLSVRKKKE